MSTQDQKKQSTAVAKQSEITALVLKKVDAFQKSGELKLPADYSPENALKSAQLILGEQKDKNGKPILQACSQASIANALLKTVVWGLSPLKGQVYYIPYGATLEASVAYTGNIAIAKRYGGLKSIKAVCIMKGDDFEFEIDAATGRRKVTKHKQTLESIGADTILGAYAIYELNDGTVDTEIMNMSQIQASWEQGATNGKSPAHKKFPDQMAIKTVINRACKLLIRSSDDKILYDDEDKNLDYTKENVQHEIDENANGEILDIDAEEVHEPEVQEEAKPEPQAKAEDTAEPKRTF